MTAQESPQALPEPPYSVGAEKSVLSTILQEPERFYDAANLTAAHFYLPAHRDLFEVLRERLQSGKEIELVSLTQHLLDEGQLARIGGPGNLTEIYTYSPSPGHFKAHIEILTDKLARRMVLSAASEMKRLAYEADSPVELLEATAAPISAIHDVVTSNKPSRDTKAILRNCTERFRKLCAGESDPMGIETSLQDINRMFRGLHGKQTVVISGYPGGGKTVLAAQLAMDAALEERNTLICSLELPEETLMNRIIAYVARRPGDAITDPRKYALEVLKKSAPSKEMLQAIGRAMERISKCPLHIEDLTGANVHQIAACIRRAHRKKPLEVVVVDFVQRIRPVAEMRRESREQQLAHASNTLADMSKELDFCLLLPSQLNKEGAAKHAEAINEDADLHLQILQDRGGRLPPMTMSDSV